MQVELSTQQYKKQKKRLHPLTPFKSRGNSLKQKQFVVVKAYITKKNKQ
jgi:hypothetical protein